MKIERRLTAETRALLAARGWHVTQLFQPQWRFRPGPRRLSRVPHDDDPWEAWIYAGTSLLGDLVGRGAGDTPEEAVKAVFRERADLKAACRRLESEIERLAFLISEIVR